MNGKDKKQWTPDWRIVGILVFIGTLVGVGLYSYFNNSVSNIVWHHKTCIFHANDKSTSAENITEVFFYNTSKIVSCIGNHCFEQDSHLTLDMGTQLNGTECIIYQ